MSYLLGLDQKGLLPLLNDTFASNENVWMDQNEIAIKPIANSQTGDQQLILNTDTQLTVGADNQLIQKIDAFQLVTSVTFSSPGEDNSYYGIQLGITMLVIMK